MKLSFDEIKRYHDNGLLPTLEGKIDDLLDNVVGELLSHIYRLEEERDEAVETSAVDEGHSNTLSRELEEAETSLSATKLKVLQGEVRLENLSNKYTELSKWYTELSKEHTILEYEMDQLEAKYNK